MSGWLAVAAAGLAGGLALWPAMGPGPRAVRAAPAPSGTRGLVDRAAGYVARRWDARRRSARRDAQLPELLERIASGLRAGLALGPSVVAATEGSPAPLADDLAPVARALRHGTPLGVALEHWAAQPTASEDVRLVAAALELSRQAGGSASRAVDRVAATLRERRELRAEVRSLATQARASAGVLAVAPLAFTALVATIEPGVVGVLVTTPLGAGCLLGGVTLQGLGATWMTRIVRSAW